MPWNDRQWSDGGAIVDMAPSPLSPEDVEIPPIAQGNSPRVLVTVYNIEVQDNATYYVGRSGLWVHHKNTKLTVT